MPGSIGEENARFLGVKSKIEPSLSSESLLFFSIGIPVTRMNPRGRWRRRRNLRRVPTTDLDRRWRAENSPLPLQNSVQVPVF